MGNEKQPKHQKRKQQEVRPAMGGWDCIALVPMGGKRMHQVQQEDAQQGGQQGKGKITRRKKRTTKKRSSTRRRKKRATRRGKKTRRRKKRTMRKRKNKEKKEEDNKEEEIYGKEEFTKTRMTLPGTNTQQGNIRPVCAVPTTGSKIPRAEDNSSRTDPTNNSPTTPPTSHSSAAATPTWQP